MKFELWMTEDLQVLAEMAEQWKEKLTPYNWKGFKVEVRSADVWLTTNSITWMWSHKTGLIFSDRNKANDGIFQGKKKIDFGKDLSDGLETFVRLFKKRGIMSHPDLYSHYMGWSISAGDNDVKQFIRGRMRGNKIAIHSIVNRRYTDEIYKNWDWCIDQALNALRRYAV